ncbi:MAG: DNA mismatch repair protein MutS [Bacteroidetes bacterium]|nr:DNA mismatch repair protein MutS [Bacteroidota bacterium]MCL5738776.1 DNA mismatch repair protein MutS [Bacteroidota bacterium]
MSRGASITPVMLQYRRVKDRYPDAIVLFRMGDFYETFEEDAKIASAVLSLTLTKRANGAAADVPLAGFPHHAINQYLPKLVKAGYRVAVCEQLEDPKLAKGIVKRDIVEVVTPGVNFSAESVKVNNYFAALITNERGFGLAFCDATTGEFNFSHGEIEELETYLTKIEPLEVVLPRDLSDKLEPIIQGCLKRAIITRRDDYIFNFDYAYDKLIHHFNVQNLKGFGIESKMLAVEAAGAALDYLAETQNGNLSHIVGMSEFSLSGFLEINRTSSKHLEIVESTSEVNATLLGIMDSTETAMGARFLRRMLLQPLKSVSGINARLDAVEELTKNSEVRRKLSEQLSGFGDLERLVARISTKRASPRELGALRTMLTRIPDIKSEIVKLSSTLWIEIGSLINPEPQLLKRLSESLSEDLPAQASDGGVIRKGYNGELDELRGLSFNAKDWIARLQVTERQRTGIQSLKVDYNSVFGYYIEITKSNLPRVPQDYIRKQTLVNAERFVTQELKEYEEKVLHAEEKIQKLELQLFEELRNEVAMHSSSLLATSRALALADVLLSFSIVARENNYVRPVIDESLDLEIEAGRHPVVERVLPSGESFVPNDLILSEGKEQIALITGPNMAGKSVFIRQVALIILIAQAGSFVPAKRARIGVVDKIFTRVGASDNISAGESTFMVEMQEAADILNNATPKSLVLLDEIGRGTSTFDGVSIAWSIVEYLHQNPARTARTLFATHYHELNELSELYQRVKNFKADVREYGGKVVFLHKIVEGSADHSYGIHVAEMAGLPKAVTSRAKEILKNLESFELSATESASLSHGGAKMPKPHKVLTKTKEGDLQIEMFQLGDEELRQKIKGVDVNNLTPVEALNKIAELKKIIEKEK